LVEQGEVPHRRSVETWSIAAEHFTEDILQTSMQDFAANKTNYYFHFSPDITSLKVFCGYYFGSKGER
jgi:hypothetical protein